MSDTQPVDADPQLIGDARDCLLRPYFDDSVQILIKIKAGRAVRLSFNSNQGWC